VVAHFEFSGIGRRERRYRHFEAAWERDEQSGRLLPPVEARPQATSAGVAAGATQRKVASHCTGDDSDNLTLALKGAEPLIASDVVFARVLALLGGLARLLSARSACRAW